MARTNRDSFIVQAAWSEANLYRGYRPSIGKSIVRRQERATARNAMQRGDWDMATAPSRNALGKRNVYVLGY